MTTFTIEIRPKKPTYDPVARALKADLLEAGWPAALTDVVTERLYRIEGDLTEAQVKNVAEKLLVDPVVETARMEVQEADTKKKKTPAAKGTGWILDIWPKAGVTDPVGETVEKGLRDLGFQGSFRASTAQRYIFPKIKDQSAVETLARTTLANKLIHDIVIRKFN